MGGRNLRIENPSGKTDKSQIRAATGANNRNKQVVQDAGLGAVGC